MADIPTSCRAALLTGHRQPLEIAEVPIPQELEPGALLVRNTAATICASDVHLWEGESGSSSDSLPAHPRPRDDGPRRAHQRGRRARLAG